MLTQTGKLKEALCLTKKRAKGIPPEKSTMDKKERIAYSRLPVMMQNGEMKSMTVMMMSEEQS
jgi:hypothetical protein